MYLVTRTSTGASIAHDGERLVHSDDMGEILRALGAPTPLHNRVADVAAHLLCPDLEVPLSTRPAAYIAVGSPGEASAWDLSVAQLAWQEGYWPALPVFPWLPPSDRARVAALLPVVMEPAVVVYALAPVAQARARTDMVLAARRGLPIRVVKPSELLAWEAVS
jgi:hypothetical protein